MTATINTDASHSPIKKIGSYAFWIVMNNRRYMSSGLLRGKIEDSNEAELKAIANALHHLLVNIKPETITKLYINTDSTTAIHLINEKKVTSKSGKYGKELALIQSLVKNVNFEMRHVKGHRRVNSKRTYVNDWCDKESRKAINEFLKRPK